MFIYRLIFVMGLMLHIASAASAQTILVEKVELAGVSIDLPTEDVFRVYVKACGWLADRRIPTACELAAVRTSNEYVHLRAFVYASRMAPAEMKGVFVEKAKKQHEIARAELKKLLDMLSGPSQ